MLFVAKFESVFFGSRHESPPHETVFILTLFQLLLHVEVALDHQSVPHLGQKLEKGLDS